ncbi:F0F1 ATP synthase subunit B [Pararhodobacter aggregans]|uniref:ATP synthase subunit b n=1 Tax=Pararhodobacter aggregans TaxID=404875 RepID=A0A2T7UU98_9RHOB|nr:F0F1 ATP synthase subunit B [Pararhodobacter aggregans]PTX02946.1 F-type H+-transporting ATPase subunit b [Pararhodobacter aggregans]PVE48158.1 ATP F0F1 synthase subunit B [Pararhodobacter aggregans]
MTRLLAVMLAVAASPAMAASGPFFSLRNTDFVVLLAFLLFIAVLLYFKVPGLIGGLLDKRAATIRAELEEARKLREEAQELRASFERKKAEVKDQADRIVAKAKADAEVAAAQAKADLETSIARRLRAAEDQIAAAEAAAVREVRNRAIAVSVAAASDLIAKNLTAEDANKMIEDSIATVEQRLH